MIMKMRIVGVVCTLLLLCPVLSHGEVWNLADDFSATQNPSGAWSYGWRETAEQPMILYTDTSHEPDCDWDVDGWRYDVWEGVPEVQHNPHDYSLYCGNIVLEANAVMFHPGPAQQSVVRWTASEDMNVSLVVTFESIDIGAKVVHVYYNGSEVFSATLDYLGETAVFNGAAVLHAGDVIDCAIDPISFYYDSTRLDVVLEDGEPTPVQSATWGRIRASYR